MPIELQDVMAFSETTAEKLSTDPTFYPLLRKRLYAIAERDKLTEEDRVEIGIATETIFFLIPVQTRQKIAPDELILTNPPPAILDIEVLPRVPAKHVPL